MKPRQINTLYQCESLNIVRADHYGRSEKAMLYTRWPPVLYQFSTVIQALMDEQRWHDSYIVGRSLGRANGGRAAVYLNINMLGSSSSFRARHKAPPRLPMLSADARKLALKLARFMSIMPLTHHC